MPSAPIDTESTGNKDLFSPAAAEAHNSQASLVSPQETLCAKTNITPRKFALQDLKPLYNSIERTLGIFQKTGVAAEYHKEEDEFAARIVIYIPKRG